jgi:hypothetical protein
MLNLLNEIILVKFSVIWKETRVLYIFSDKAVQKLHVSCRIFLYIPLSFLVIFWVRAERRMTREMRKGSLRPVMA